MTTHHADKKALTGPQLAVLRWIADGRPEGVFEGYAHRQSARALENRGLARVWGHGPSWRAELTDSGRAAVDTLADVPASAESADISPVELLPVDELLGRLVAAGGALDVGSEFTRDELQRFTHDALRSNARPHGQQLTYDATDGWQATRFVVRLTPYFEDTVEARPVPVPERVGKLHPVARAFRDAKAGPVSKEHLTRAVRIVHALATEAERRGFTVSHPSVHSEQRYGHPRPLDGSIALAKGADRIVFELRELPPNKGAARPYVWAPAYDWRSPGRMVPNDKFVPTGVLQLGDPKPSSYNNVPRYRDNRRAMLEDQLPQVFRDIELKRLYAEERARQAKLAAAERRAQKERQLANARERARETERVNVLDRQIADWRRAAELREFAAALADADGTDEAAEWIAWIRERAGALDPCSSGVRVPTVTQPSEAAVAEQLGLGSHFGIAQWLSS